jgi:hypothetical protein
MHRQCRGTFAVRSLQNPIRSIVLATIEGCVDVKNDYNEAFAQRLKQIDERAKMERQGLQKLIQIQEQSQKELVVHNVALQQ